MAYSLPVGIQHLISLSEVKVKQKLRGCKEKKYTVQTLHDEVVYQAKEDNDVVSTIFGGRSRSFNLKIYDVQNQLAFTLRRAYTIENDKMEVWIDDSPACVVRRQSTFITPLLHINDANDRPVLRIKGSFADWNFKLQTASKLNIGSVVRKFQGFFKEMFTDIDTYLVSFPMDLDVRYKAAVIGSCVLIDYMYHERK